MTEETTLSGKPASHTAHDSQFFGITIRAWLALLVIGTVCLVTIASCIRAIWIKDYNWTADGQFWMLAGGIMAHYFGDKKSTTTQKT